METREVTERPVTEESLASGSRRTLPGPPRLLCSSALTNIHRLATGTTPRHAALFLQYFLAAQSSLLVITFVHENELICDAAGKGVLHTPLNIDHYDKPELVEKQPGLRRAGTLT